MDLLMFVALATRSFVMLLVETNITVERDMSSPTAKAFWVPVLVGTTMNVG